MWNIVGRRVGTVIKKPVIELDTRVIEGLKDHGLIYTQHFNSGYISIPDF